ncbi:MAG TPA: hypothetical protein DHV42_04610 [Lachnospiraceae bacterium]|nr:hypothetical protein [Lachnospiraceae bacterium]
MNRISKYERTSANDIKYRGPLSYQHLLIFGWLCISFKVLGVLTSLAISLDKNQPQWIYTLHSVGETLGYFALPLFLIANFAIILDKKKTYKQQLMKFGGLSLGIVLIFIIVKEHNLLELFTAVLGNREEANKILTDALYESAVSGSLIFNLFIDLFLCTLFMFFLEYVPQKHFQGKKLRLFRAMAVFPVLYEIGALAIRIRITLVDQKPPYLVYPFLTTKPFMSFVLFIFLALHIKLEGVRFSKKGKTEEHFESYTQTNAHSLRFSVYASVVIAITALIDFLLSVYSSIILSYLAAGVNLNAELTVETEDKLNKVLPLAMQVTSAWRIGTHWPMIFLVPVILLFSYTRVSKKPKLDTLIPIGGVLLALLVGIEGMHQGIVMNLTILINKIMEMAAQYMK